MLRFSLLLVLPFLNPLTASAHHAFAAAESDLFQPAATDGAASISIPRMKVAIVAVDSHAVKVLGHYVQYAIQVTTRWEFGIFNSMQDAMHWAAHQTGWNSAHDHT